ncbi:hypothetical protein [Nocardioides sp. NPDC047086]|uniref:hypothetical protein n=1 Tax=Nocardioides sp. NPDC047086 TaxID=3154810 RepID=UPI0033F72F5A
MNVVPCRTSSLCTCGMYLMSVAARSSTLIINTFGRPDSNRPGSAAASAVDVGPHSTPTVLATATVAIATRFDLASPTEGRRTPPGDSLRRAAANER